MPEDELKEWALQGFDLAYRSADRREKCSRSDFWAGYRACLIEFRVWTAFQISPPEANS